MNKEIYESPEMEIVEFEMADVITTSNGCKDTTVPEWGDYPWPGTCRDSQYLFNDSCAGITGTIGTS